MSLPTLFWDFHGTLIEPKSTWAPSLCRVLEGLGVQADTEEVRLHMKAGFSWHTPDIPYPQETGGAWWQKLYRHLDALYDGFHLSDALRAEANQGLRQEILCKERYVLFEDAVEVLDSLRKKGYRHYLLSNNFPELEDVVEAMGLRNRFCGCIVSACVGYEKPHPEIFRLALELAGNPESAIMIGDNPIADVEGGRAAGMGVIQVHNDAASKADYRCASLAEVMEVLSQWD